MNRKSPGLVLVILLLTLCLSGCSTMSQQNTNTIKTSNSELNSGKTTVRAEHELTPTKREAARANTRSAGERGRQRIVYIACPSMPAIKAVNLPRPYPGRKRLRIKRKIFWKMQFPRQVSTWWLLAILVRV